MGARNPITARKSGATGFVSVIIALSCNGWGVADRARIDANTNLTVTQTRDLIAELNAAVEKVEAVAAAKVASDARRAKWREREIAAGRMVILSGRP